MRHAKLANVSFVLQFKILTIFLELTIKCGAGNSLSLRLADDVANFSDP